MTRTPPDEVLGSHARLAGIAYLAIIVTSILSLLLVESRLIVEGDLAATSENITANMDLFRVGLAQGLLMFAGVVVLAWALYVILRTVSESLAMLALLFRIVEAVVGSVTVLSGLMAVLLLDRVGGLASFDVAQVQALSGFCSTCRRSAWIS